MTSSKKKISTAKTDWRLPKKALRVERCFAPIRSIYWKWPIVWGVYTAGLPPYFPVKFQ